MTKFRSWAKELICSRTQSFADESNATIISLTPCHFLSQIFVYFALFICAGGHRRRIHKRKLDENEFHEMIKTKTKIHEVIKTKTKNRNDRRKQLILVITTHNPCTLNGYVPKGLMGFAGSIMQIISQIHLLLLTNP